MDHPAPLLRDLAMRAGNRTEGERLRKANEDKRKKKQWKLQAQERREDTNNDSDDDDGDDLENDDVLTGIGSSL